MTADYLAFDLGAESGRAMLGRLRDGRLALEEIHRFPNQPLHENGSLRWDIRRLWVEMRQALDGAPKALASIGVDTWGVDFGLLDAKGELIENPYHYRDTRTEGVMDSVFMRVSRERIYTTTGIQFLPFNTLYQLYATSPEVIERSECLLTIPDLLNFWLTGKRASEYTIATTTQLIDARTRAWAFDLIAELQLPARLFQPIVESGAEIGSWKDVPVIAPACHDTGSAVAAVEMSPDSAFLSSGTWSLLGAELTRPVITPRARDLNFTNEGGACGTVRVLKNIAGMWLLQSCRRSWPECSYEDLLSAAKRQPAFISLIDPDDPVFLNPPDMPEAIAAYCVRTGQPTPASPPAFARAILESLALKYREVLESLEEITGRRFREIRVIGGGSRNRLLNQFTADATGRTVIAGPVEATSMGNIAMQMLATGAVATLSEARAIIAQSFATDRFEPASAVVWDDAIARFSRLRGV
jgi:rhamnulokinase